MLDRLLELIQESVSAERTPTLHLVIPLYEELLDILKSLKLKFPKLYHALDAAILKLDDYIKIARGSKIYGLAIARKRGMLIQYSKVINPMFKLEYICERWGDEEAVKVKAYLCEAMLAFQRKWPFEPNAASPSPAVWRQIKVKKVCSASGIAAWAQTSCIARVRALKRGLEDGNTDTAAQPTNTAESENSGPSTADRDTWDQAEVDKQLSDWENTGILDEDDDFDLVRWWDMPKTIGADSNKSRWSLIFKVAMDVLPVQASARSNLSPQMFEILQILKYSYRELWYLDDLLLDQESIIEILDLGPGVAEKMIQEGRMDELVEMLRPLQPGGGEDEGR
ncbi:hypothetical protein PM082_018231 [Marasmius tenuissimus]|nr:hypothetical protein PM082_018231 [Marasmius tenuissimus]